MSFFIHHANSSLWAIEQDLQMWVPVTLEQPVGKVRLSLEVQPRFSDDISHLSVVRVRPSITLNLSQKVSLTGGYFWSPIFPASQNSDETLYENRLWQQATVSHPWRQARINHQLRLEQRFLPQNAGTSVRARYLTRLVYPMGKKHLKNWSYVASQELLWNVNSTDALPAGFNQARIFSGLRYQLHSNVALEGGYLLQWVNQPGPQSDNLNHVVLVRTQMTLPKWGHKSSEFAKQSKPLENVTDTPLILD